ncbi:hypothetical protein D3C84_1247560 [compost metagenome]
MIAMNAGGRSARIVVDSGVARSNWIDALTGEELTADTKGQLKTTLEGFGYAVWKAQ